MGWNDGFSMDAMIGVTMKKVTGEGRDEEMVFEAEDGRRFIFYHQQDCCESVAIEDVCGDLSDLVGSPIVRAEERTEEGREGYDSCTWTFYEFATNKGSVTVRWLGTSNGYYSERVDCRLEMPSA